MTRHRPARTATPPSSKARRRRAAGGVGALVLVAGLGLSACNPVSTLARPDAPVVLTGSQLPSLAGTDPTRIVAFRHTTVGSTSQWTQIPVQIDQRKVVPFGINPSSNTAAGTVGTVYGNGVGGPTAPQYADPATWVGADDDPTLDPDDEVVFMAADAGGQPGKDDPAEPVGVVAGSGQAVRVTDPRTSGQQGWVYLFRSDGTLDPAAGQDYVDYDFALTSGPYLSTYKRAQGPNPETSRVVTPTYEIGFTDRWMETSWKVAAGGATGVDILDAAKNQFAVNYCGRSNQTFVNAEGAFVANIDGPVRAIRSYVGANSGPLTERTHLMYRDREEVVTDLRVHSIPAIMDFLDYSAAAVGMTYRSSVVTNGALVNGTQDLVALTLPAWESVDGPQGRVDTAIRLTTSQTGIEGSVVEYYRDQTTPSETECFGDGSFYGASGAYVQTGINNTDPRTTPFDTLRATRTNRFLGPTADPSTIVADAGDWAADLDAPLTVSVAAYAP